MSSHYVQSRDGNLYVGTSRVTLDSIILPWQQGVSPEAIQRDYPTLPLAYVYGSIAYYLEHQPELDEWLREGEQLYQERRTAAQAADPEFYSRMRETLAHAREQRREDMPTPESGEEQSHSALESPAT